MIQAVIQVLINDTRVQEAVKLNKASDRYKVFPVVADQDEHLPYTVGSVISNQPSQCKDAESSLDRISFQLLTYAKTYEDVDKIDNAIRFSIDGFNGISAGIELNIWFDGHSDAWDNGKQSFVRVANYQSQVKRTI